MVKFEGKVNGQTFDNVADYNQALQEALNNGGLVNASSRTYTSTEEPENEGQQTLDNSHLNISVDKIVSELPMAQLDKLTGDPEHDGEFVDNSFVVYDLETAKTTLDSIIDKAAKDECVLRNIIRIIYSRICESETNAKNNDIAHHSLEEDYEKIENEMNALSNKLDLLDKKLNITDSAGEILDLQADFYKYLYRNLLNYAKSIGLDNCENTNVGCCGKPADVRETQPPKEFTFAINPSAKLNVDAFKRLVEEIFS